MKKQVHDAICIIIILISVAAVVFDKIYLRSAYNGNNFLLKLFIGSAPNFFAAFGSGFIYPIFKENVTTKKFRNTSFSLAAGLILYELDQLRGGGTFDYYDIAATLFAAALSTYIYKNFFINQIKKDAQYDSTGKSESTA